MCHIAASTTREPRAARQPETIKAVQTSQPPSGKPARKKLALPVRMIRMVASLLIGAVLSLLGIPSAAASTATGDQNPDYQVSVSLMSNGKDPETAAPGDMVSAALSVTNESTSFKQVTVLLNLKTPTGGSMGGSFTVPMSPKQTLARDFNFTVPQDLTPGQYQVTVEAGTEVTTTPSPGPTPGPKPAPRAAGMTGTGFSPDQKDPPGDPVVVSAPGGFSSATATITIS